MQVKMKNRYDKVRIDIVLIICVIVKRHHMRRCKQCPAGPSGVKTLQVNIRKVKNGWTKSNGDDLISDSKRERLQ